MAEGNKLRQDLRWWQIFFIVASTVIGEGIFSGDGRALRTGGPAGALLAMFIFSVIVICVMEGVSEFVQLYPCPNAIVEYIEHFVDKDLALVCGIAYWYTFASIFATLNLTAGNQTGYWAVSEFWAIGGFYILSPLILLGINLVGVDLFGWIESVGGILKLTLVFGTGVLMYVLSGSDGVVEGDQAPIYDGFQYDPKVVANAAAAVCANIPVIAYSLIGTESVAVTAFEARYSRSLRLPSRSLAYVLTLLYLFTAIGEFTAIDWMDKRLASNNADNASATTENPGHPNTTNMPVIVAWEAGIRGLPGFLNVCYIFSALSASNSSLYVASRTLYGLTRELNPEYFITRNLNKLSRVVHKTGVPGMALLVSVMSFIWLPFLHLQGSFSATVTLEFFQTTAIVSLLIVWAALSLAFIRYQLWLKKCSEFLSRERYSEFNRRGPNYKAYTFLGFAQPLPAYIGLIGSLAIVFIFTTVSWWSDDHNIGYKVAVAYTAPIVFIVLWLFLKGVGRLLRPDDFQWWVPIGDDLDDFARLSKILNTLKWLKVDETEREETGSPVDRHEMTYMDGLA